MPYEILDHTADTGIEATGSSLAELIDQLATGMFELMAPVDPCPGDVRIEIDVAAPTLEDLVVETLSELLYESEAEDLLLCGFETTVLGNTRVRVSAGGIATSDAELSGPPIKAVTYHATVVEQREDGWFCRVYFDV